ncbi:MAG TPA: hypothetical protein DEP84_02895 [Chloroflexi bacterium]|nr:hypothetical protein [Chloroflexota bacterium]
MGIPFAELVIGAAMVVALAGLYRAIRLPRLTAYQEAPISARFKRFSWLVILMLPLVLAVPLWPVLRPRSPVRLLLSTTAFLYKDSGAIQGNSLLLMVTPAQSHIPQGGVLPIFYGVENNRPETARGRLFAEVILPDGRVIPTKEVNGTPFALDPLVKTGELVNFDIGALTDASGEMTLRFRCVENGVEMGQRAVAFTVGESGPTFFKDVTAEANVLVEHRPNPHDELPFGNGVAFTDYDTDGWVDIYITNQLGSNALFRNNGNGTFTDQARSAGVDLPDALSTGALFADYDNDGDRDLYVLRYGPNVLFQNNGDGTFTDVTAVAGVGNRGRGVSAAWGDYDRDGYLDLYVTNHTSKLTQDFSHVRSGGAAQPDPGARDALYHNNRDGTFTDVTDLLGLDRQKTGMGFVASFVDYDNDGDPDIYLVNDVYVGRAYGGNLLWRNDGPSRNGRWRFTELSEAARVNAAIFGMGLAVGDYDNNGFQDLFMSNVGRPVLYRNSGNGTFRDVTDCAGIAHAHINDANAVSWGVGLFDYDNDGWLDAYVNNGNMMYFGPSVESDPLDQPNSLFRNNRDGTFTDVSGLSGADNPLKSRALAYGDFNNDGYLDLYVSNFDGPTALYRNESHRNNWLVIKLEGTSSNRDAIGAKVRVSAAGITQLRELRSGEHHGSASEIGAFFGLGQSRNVDRLEILWPSGLVQTFANVSVNQRLHIVEGDTDRPAAAREAGK